MLLAHPSSPIPPTKSLPEDSNLMMTHGSGIVSDLLEMATTCDNTTDHAPSMKDQVTTR